MTLLLFILAGVWAAFLIPPYLRNRSDRPGDSILSFRRHLSTLERACPGQGQIQSRAVVQPNLQRIPVRSASPMPGSRADARRRRREILFTLVGAVALTLLLAVLLGGVAIICHLVAVAALGGYTYLLVQMRKNEAERAAKVRYLPQAEASEPVLLLNRTASN